MTRRLVGLLALIQITAWFLRPGKLRTPAQRATRADILDGLHRS